ncbi:MAG: phage tail sheath C-terminal domain-containing protein [Pseudomonadota bacterium]
MPVTLSYPGVYIEEVPGGGRAIAGVPTSVAAFVGYSLRGPTNTARQIFSFADFERTFGPLDGTSALSFAVNHFFLNGGATCWIVRVAEGAGEARVVLGTSGAAPEDALELTAESDGAWGNDLQVIVDYATSSPGSTFNLTVNEVRELGGQRVIARSETHRNLSMNPESSNFVETALAAESRLIRGAAQGAAAGADGATIGGPIEDAGVAGLGDGQRRIAVMINGFPLPEFDLFPEGGNAGVNTIDLAAAEIQQGVRDRIDTLPFPVVTADSFTATNGGGFIDARFAEGGLNASVVFRRASRNSATAALRLDAANGARVVDGSAPTRPAPSGTVGERFDLFAPDTITADDALTVQAQDVGGTVLAEHEVTFADVPETLAQARAMLQAHIRGGDHPALAGASVAVVDNALVARAGGDVPSVRLVFSDDAATDLQLDTGNVGLAAYQLGIGPTAPGIPQSGAAAGADGSPPDIETPAGVAAFNGDRDAKTGLFALEDADIFNILNIPDVSDVGILAPAVTYAEERRSMLLVDIGDERTLEEARAWVNDAANSSLKHRNVAAYFPQVMAADPTLGNRLRAFPNSGTIAGLWARTDAQRGVWKAPAGIDARLRGVQALEYQMSDRENGVLNPLGLNCLRSFPVYGTVSWGARTLVGADAFASEWKYVPVRRIALFIEESLYRGTQFVVFEPNDEPLWAQIRLTVGAFMQRLFRQGALQGSTPEEAYVVRCDSSTTTQDDINLGIVNIYVGFAPLRPAEFVVIQIQQLAGQGQN